MKLDGRRSLAGSRIYQFRVRLPASITTQVISNAISTIQNDLDSDNEVSEMGSMQLQMLMDSRSKLLQAASDIEKSISDSNAAIVGSIKQ